ncbi:unnamed protein product, partial [Nesidiocoris tenuis]
MQSLLNWRNGTYCNIAILAAGRPTQDWKKPSKTAKHRKQEVRSKDVPKVTMRLRACAKLKILPRDVRGLKYGGNVSNIYAIMRQ